MKLPFTREQFFDVFRLYNESVWPLQLVLLLIGAAALLSAARGQSKAASALLAALWLWMGVVYHLTFFRLVNPAAALFGALFIAQAGLFLAHGLWRGDLRFSFRGDAGGLAGIALAMYALVIYPSLGMMLGHRYPASPTFGLPCPTTIFTFAVLLWSHTPLPRLLLVVPVLWAIVGGSAALTLGVPQDFGLPVAALVALAILLRPHQRSGWRAPTEVVTIGSGERRLK